MKGMGGLRWKGALALQMFGALLPQRIASLAMPSGLGLLPNLK